MNWKKYVCMISFPSVIPLCLVLKICGISQHILNSPNSTPLSFFCKSPLETFGNKVTNRRPQSRWSTAGVLGSNGPVIFWFKQLQPMLHVHDNSEIPKKIQEKTRNAYKNRTFSDPSNGKLPIITLIFLAYLNTRSFQCVIPGGVDPVIQEAVVFMWNPTAFNWNCLGKTCPGPENWCLHWSILEEQHVNHVYYIHMNMMGKVDVTYIN